MQKIILLCYNAFELHSYSNIMWKFLKKSAYAARKRKDFLIPVTIAISLLAMIHLASILSIVAIPIGILIGLVSGLILNHCLYWFVIRNNGIPRDYVEKLTVPQESLYQEFIEFEPTLRKSLPQLLPELQNIVLNYAKNPEISKPSEFTEMIESIEIDDAIIMQSGSLKEFIYLFAAGLETSPRLSGKNYPSAQRTRFFNTLLTLSFNKPVMVSNHAAPDQVVKAFTPSSVFRLAVMKSILNEQLHSFRTLLIYIINYLNPNEYLGELIAILALNSDKLFNETLDSFLNSLYEQQLSNTITDLLNSPFEQVLLKDFIQEKGSADFIKSFIQVLHLPSDIFPMHQEAFTP